MVGERVSAYPPSVWRLVIDGEADGATNMAVDQAILESVVEGVSQPTVRFYAWAPPCLSLGRSQGLEDVDVAACNTAGIDIVRRPTGGRAILHAEELTYSVAILQTDPRSGGGVVEGYRRLSEGLLAGLLHLGVQAVQAVQAVGTRGSNEGQTAICFETSADYEITVAGRKLVGSAQWRARGGVLQHGSLPLCGNLTRIVSFLALSDAEREVQRHRIPRRAITLEEALGRMVPFDMVAQALAWGVGQALNLTLVPGEVSTRERSLASDLRDQVYGARDWTARL